MYVFLNYINQIIKLNLKFFMAKLCRSSLGLKIKNNEAEILSLLVKVHISLCLYGAIL